MSIPSFVSCLYFHKTDYTQLSCLKEEELDLFVQDERLDGTVASNMNRILLKRCIPFTTRERENQESVVAHTRTHTHRKTHKVIASRKTCFTTTLYYQQQTTFAFSLLSTHIQTLRAPLPRGPFLFCKRQTRLCRACPLTRRSTLCSVG
jgi:hypothetical protein